MNKTVEAGKKAFAGSEIAGKTLAVIGLGAIGRLVAHAAQALGMTVVGFDPALTVEGASQLSASVKRVNTVDDALAKADFLTVHVPLVDATRHPINADRLRAMKKGVVVLNFAREGIVDEHAVVAGNRFGPRVGYVSDFPTNLTRNRKGCVTPPHLGASTAEAETTAPSWSPIRSGTSWSMAISERRELPRSESAARQRAPARLRQPQHAGHGGPGLERARTRRSQGQ
jgi:D-3-phosphoglycerate dehydrogenase